jgi:hypothetical protein
LRAGARQQPSHHRGKLAATKFVWRQVRSGIRCKRDVKQRRKQGQKFCGVEFHLHQRELKVGATPLWRDFGAAKALLAPFGQRVQRGVL